MTNYSETSAFSIQILPNNIFHVTIKEGAVVDMNAAAQLVEATNNMLDCSIPFRAGIYDISKVKSVTDDARNYLSTTSDIKGTVVGTALISSTFIGRMVGNLFITLSGTSKFPIQFFDSPMGAEHWIQTRLEDEQNVNPQETEKGVA